MLGGEKGKSKKDILHETVKFSTKVFGGLQKSCIVLQNYG
jgi:hypothetical protein